MFDSLTDLQSSQTLIDSTAFKNSLIPLLIYKALKHVQRVAYALKCLIPLLIYKALKQPYV